VAFVPGTPFYVDRKDSNTLRLNFSCSDEPTIVEGIRRLGNSIRQLFNQQEEHHVDRQEKIDLPDAPGVLLPC
jgi:hypothetical protein